MTNISFTYFRMFVAAGHFVCRRDMVHPELIRSVDRILLPMVDTVRIPY